MSMSFKSKASLFSLTASALVGGVLWSQSFRVMLTPHRSPASVKRAQPAAIMGGEVKRIESRATELGLSAPQIASYLNARTDFSAQLRKVSQEGIRVSRLQRQRIVNEWAAKVRDRLGGARFVQFQKSGFRTLPEGTSADDQKWLSALQKEYSLKVRLSAAATAAGNQRRMTAVREKLKSDSIKIMGQENYVKLMAGRSS
jgi:hypothetical protein